MPIEVRELVLKATITQGDGNQHASETNNNSVSSKEEIVNICVERILSIIKEKNER